MTPEEFIENWPGSTPNQRFVNFLSLIQEEVDHIQDLLPPIMITSAAVASPVAGNPEDGFTVLISLFTEDDPEFALAAADVIIQAYYYHAMEQWNKDQKEAEEYYKDYKKYMDKLWDKLLKDAKPKGDPGYADWYYSYYLPKYYGEYGSP